MAKRQIIVALICAACAVCAVFGYTASVGSEAQTKRAAALAAYGGEQAEVVVAVNTLSAGKEITDSDIATQSWLVDLLPQASIATSAEQVVGLVAEVEIKEGEPIVLDRIGDSSSRITVPSGLEAVSIASDDVLAVGGAIKAGSFVDVYAETTTGSIALLGQKILVLETSAATSEKESDKALTWVTLAITPESVADLISASTSGTIHLVLPGGQGQSEEEQ